MSFLLNVLGGGRRTVAIVVLLAAAGVLLGVAAGNLVFAPSEEEEGAREEEPQRATSLEEVLPLPDVGLPANFPLPPSEDATEDEQTAFFEIVSGLAVEVERIEVRGGCEFSPAIIKISEPGAPIRVVNADTATHVAAITEEITLAPDEESSFSTEDFVPGGLYGIACDGVSEKGFVIVGE